MCNMVQISFAQIKNEMLKKFPKLSNLLKANIFLLDFHGRVSSAHNSFIHQQKNILYNWRFYCKKSLLSL